MEQLLVQALWVLCTQPKLKHSEPFASTLCSVHTLCSVQTLCSAHTAQAGAQPQLLQKSNNHLDRGFPRACRLGMRMRTPLHRAGRGCESLWIVRGLSWLDVRHLCPGLLQLGSQWFGEVHAHKPTCMGRKGRQAGFPEWRRDVGCARGEAF